MVDPITPLFAQPGTYVRYYGSSIFSATDSDKKFRYLRLLEMEGPLRYPYSFTSIAVDVKGASVTFSDLDVAQGHIYQVFLGVQKATFVQMFAPFDTRILNFDTSATAISPDETAVLGHSLTPYEAPTFDFWIPPNKQYPALVPINRSGTIFPGGKTIIPQVIFVAANFRTEQILETTIDPRTQQAVPNEIFDMLAKKKIYSLPIRMGGTIRSIPR